MLLKLKNVSDVITNSSSEVFICKASEDGLDAKAIAKTIKSFIRSQKMGRSNSDYEYTDNSSGMGGDWEVTTWEDAYNNYLKRNSKTKKEITPEKWAQMHDVDLNEIRQYVRIDIDWSRKASINFIIKEFDTIRYDYEENNKEFEKIDDLLCVNNY